MTTEETPTHEETTQAITTTYTRVSPKLSGRFGFFKEESKENIVALEVKQGRANKSIFNDSILFNFSFILLLRL